MTNTVDFTPYFNYSIVVILSETLVSILFLSVDCIPRNPGRLQPRGCGEEDAAAYHGRPVCPTFQLAGARGEEGGFCSPKDHGCDKSCVTKSLYC